MIKPTKKELIAILKEVWALTIHVLILPFFFLYCLYYGLKNKLNLRNKNGKL